MSSLSKRYCVSGAICTAFLVILIILPVFNYHKKEIKNSVHQDAEISFVTVKKKAPPKTIQEKKEKIKQKSQNTIPSEKPAESPAPEEQPEEAEQTDAIEEDNPAVQKATSTYKEYVLSRIASKKVYPLSSRARGETGRVKLHVSVSSGGELLCAEIVKGSPYELLNQASLNAVKKASPFKKCPEGVNGLDMVFAMDFTLE